eukprot:CAMPEP_0168777770 /NCGR_PEP_ID=MMETSP0725-20121227/6743_1 /TAXON_ID=265536 /ORGANISM="Amphiprora sp., Strain CCMP467" /LENGTH=38 /DNA_ID= /DNA_START= /DNA_END= /DNA_ORIENTATION=
MIIGGQSKGAVDGRIVALSQTPIISKFTAIAKHGTRSF